MVSTACIPGDRLRLLLLGELPDEAAAPLEDHLLDCPQCLARTRSLKSADTLVAALQGARAGEFSAEQSSSVQRLVQRLSDRSQLATHSSLLDATVAPGSGKDLIVEQIVARLQPAAKPDELGRLGSFRVLKLLGHGGMGAVFLAEDVHLRRHVALKLLKPGLIDDREAVERFMREARAAAAVRHDHVVTIFQVGEVNGVPFLAQELLEGETLEDRLRREDKLPIGDSLRIGREIAAGLAAAHGRGLLHRDIKPSNIWLEKGDSRFGVRDSIDPQVPSPESRAPTPSRAKLLDFGLARIETDDVQLTQSGMIVGTPAFMSPEQAQGKPIDFRSDLFSLGCVLYRMVTGKLPFQGTDTLSMLRSLAVDEPPPARKLNPQVPSELSDFIAKLLHKDPLQRPWSAENVASRLAAIASTWDTRPACPYPSLPSGEGRGEGFQHRLFRTPRRPAIVLGLVGVLALLAAAIIITITRPDGTKTEIKVDGDAKVEIATDSSKPKATADGATDQPNKVTGNNGSLPVKQPSISIAKPIYENDFSAPDPKWSIPDDGRGYFWDIRDGHLLFQSTGRKYVTLGSGTVPYVDQADIEVVGRASSGFWGIGVVTNGRQVGEPGFNIIVGPDGSLIAWWGDSGKTWELPIRQLPVSFKPDGEFNTLRVVIEKRSVEVWMNGERACEKIELERPLGPALILFVGLGHEKLFSCEFDSLRIWRAGEGPSRPPVSDFASKSINPGSKIQAQSANSEADKPTAGRRSARPIYERDFSKSVPEWEGPPLDARFRNGRLTLKSGGSGARTAYDVPATESADLEIAGHSTSGYFGFSVFNDADRHGMVFAFDPVGKLGAAEMEIKPTIGLTFRAVYDFRAKPIRSWRADGAANVLRATVHDRTVQIWVNGEPACDKYELKYALAPFRVGIAVLSTDGIPCDCDFDSLRIWRAGEAPLVLAAKPIYETDFATRDPHWFNPDKGGKYSSDIQDGHLVLQNSGGKYWPCRATNMPPVDQADIEVVGRASSGMWGTVVASRGSTNRGIVLAIDSAGQLMAWRSEEQWVGKPTLLPIKPLPPKVRPEGEFNTLQVSVREQSIAVWLNGERACEDIPLQQPLGESFIGVAGYATDKIFRCEFDSLRIWRAGEAPPVIAQATQPTAPNPATAKPKYENDFSDPNWLQSLPDEIREIFSIRDGCFVIQAPGKASQFSNIGNVADADLEIVGRATAGRWGFYLRYDQKPEVGVRITLTSSGEVEADRVESGIGRTHVLISPKPVASWKGDGAFNTLRAVVQGGQVKLWVNGEQACDPIKLPAPTPWMTLALLGTSKGPPGLHCEFDSYRVWPAGEGPPLLTEKTIVDPNSFTDYVGRYDYTGGQILTVSAQGEAVFGHITGQRNYQLDPKAKDEFFFKNADGTNSGVYVRFLRDEHGQVNAARHTQTGANFTGAKLDEDAVQLTAEQLDALVGEYQNQPGHLLTVSRRGTQLQAQGTGARMIALIPKSESEFEVFGGWFKMQFVKDDGGKVTDAILRQDGKTSNLPKIK